MKNCKKIADGVTFIDEPEISMHPCWQAKVLDYYKNIFTESSCQKTQCFFATHSEIVISQALKDRDNTLVIVLTDNGQITARNIVSPNVLPIITSAETNYLAFNVASVDYHIELYGYLQNKIGKTSVKDCDSYIISCSEYRPSVHYKPSHHGSTAYDTICTYIRNAIDHPDNGNTFTDEELKVSIDLLIVLCK